MFVLVNIYQVELKYNQTKYLHLKNNAISYVASVQLSRISALMCKMLALHISLTTKGENTPQRFWGSSVFTGNILLTSVDTESDLWMFFPVDFHKLLPAVCKKQLCSHDLAQKKHFWRPTTVSCVPLAVKIFASFILSDKICKLSFQQLWALPFLTVA